MSVGPTWVVLYRGGERLVEEGLTPDTEYELHGAHFRTLIRPHGELLTSFATVNDVHFGETEAGKWEGSDVGPVLSAAPGTTPYPALMSQAIASEMDDHGVELVAAKGDLTSSGTFAQYDDFLACYGARFGDRLLHVRGNHDAYHYQDFADWPTQRRDLPGCTVLMLDTSKPGAAGGRLTDEQVEWVDNAAATADRPVILLGHHHAWDPDSAERPDSYFGIHPDWSERLVEVVARRPRIVAYAAGHTHRNRVRHFSATGQVPWIELASAKDFPGSWALCEVYEDGILHIHQRAAAPEALAWSEKCRAMFFGMYADYALGPLEARSFAIATER